MLLTTASCKTEFNREEFLADCQFTIEDKILSDSNEYSEIISRQDKRLPEVDSLYLRFHKTHDHDLNLIICRRYGEGTFMRSWGRGADSLLADNFFARAIRSSTKKDEIIELILLYGFDKPYPYQQLISEVCLRPEYYVNDTLKYRALNYAIDSNYHLDDSNMELVRKYSRENWHRWIYERIK